MLQSACSRPWFRCEKEGVERWFEGEFCPGIVSVILIRCLISISMQHCCVSHVIMFVCGRTKNTGNEPRAVPWMFSGDNS